MAHIPHANKDVREQDTSRQTASLAALAVALVLVIFGLFLVQTLRRGAQIEDCLMAGRINCDRLIQR